MDRPSVRSRIVDEGIAANEIRHAIANGANGGRNYRTGKFKRLPGTHGKRYVFEAYSKNKGKVNITLLKLSPLIVYATSAPVASTQLRRKKTPKVCSCPEHHPATEGSTSGVGLSGRQTIVRNYKNAGPTFITKTHMFPAIQQVEIAPVVTEQGLCAEEIATACGRCKNLRKAPKGKKISWRKSSNTWMLVGNRAEDEDRLWRELTRKEGHLTMKKTTIM